MGSGKRAVPTVAGGRAGVLIGFGRAHLGAHYLSDVMGGFAAGGTWLGAVVAG
jgi:membrane-associated phospholipid phosphatase